MMARLRSYQSLAVPGTLAIRLHPLLPATRENDIFNRVSLVPWRVFEGPVRLMASSRLSAARSSRRKLLLGAGMVLLLAVVGTVIWLHGEMSTRAEARAA